MLDSPAVHSFLLGFLCHFSSEGKKEEREEGMGSADGKQRGAVKLQPRNTGFSHVSGKGGRT